MVNHARGRDFLAVYDKENKAMRLKLTSYVVDVLRKIKEYTHIKTWYYISLP